MEPAAQDRLLTADEYSRLPDDGPWQYELQSGLIVAEPLPLYRHGQIQVRLAHILFEFAEPRGLGVVLTHVGFLLATNPDTVRGPDVAFLRRGRVDPADAERGFLRLAPDLAVEILSPSNRPGEIHAKVADYLAAGSTLVWVIDPARSMVSVYRTLLKPRRVPADGTLDGEDVLPGLSTPVAALLEP